MHSVEILINNSKVYFRIRASSDVSNTSCIECYHLSGRPEPRKCDQKTVRSYKIEGTTFSYKNFVSLENGSATINLDTVSGMTEGTYILLNTNTQCFTSNETDWDAVKGSVTGNILTISCENTSSTATVSWLVIGERHDQHMIDTDWTDENGKVIVEKLKETEGKIE